MCLTVLQSSLLKDTLDMAYEITELIKKSQGSFRETGEDAPHGTFLPPLEIVLLKFTIDVDKCLTKCMSSESMHM